MPKSKGPRKPKAKTNLPKRQTPPRSLRTVLANMSRVTVAHPVALLFGLLAAVGALAELVHQAVLNPEISAERDADSSYPLALPFNIKNNSWIFSMDNAQMDCWIDEVLTKDGGSFRYFSVVNAKKVTIHPKDKAAFRCALSGTPGQSSIFAVPRDAIASAHIFLRVTHTTFWIPRVSPPTEFTWYTAASPPRWIEGKIVD